MCRESQDFCGSQALFDDAEFSKLPAILKHGRRLNCYPDLPLRAAFVHRVGGIDVDTASLAQSAHQVS